MKHEVKITLDRKLREIVLHTPYSWKEKCEALSSRRWDKKTSTWRVPALLPSIDEVLDLFGTHAEVEPRVWALKNKLLGSINLFDRLRERTDLTARGAGYQWRIKPFPHQVSGTLALLARDNVMLLDQMGLGKTKTVVDAAVARFKKREISRVIVLCPMTLKRTWGGDEKRGIEGEIQMNAPPEIGGFDQVLVVDGPPKKREAQLRDAFSKKWIIMNYELARIHEDILAQLVQGQYLVCDEAHKLKNIKSQTYKVVRDLEYGNLTLMTGTPVANTPLDIYALVELTEPGLLGMSYPSFVKTYTKKGGFKGKEIIGFKNLEELQARLKTVSIRRIKSQVMKDLPPKLYETRTVEMHGDQKKQYSNMQKEMWAFYRDMPQSDYRLVAQHAITQLLRLQQIADGFISVKDMRTQWFDSQPKLSELDDIVEEICEREGKKLVVWSRFIPATLGITERYNKMGVRSVMMHGGLSSNDRSSIVHEFKTDPDCKIFVSQVHTGGLGLTLTESDTQVFYDRWWSPSINEQAEDRLHRIGTKSNVTVISLACRGSIDENVIRLLADKKRWADRVTGDPETTKLSKDDLLNLIR